MIENDSKYGKTTSENIRLFLEFWPDLQAEFHSAWEMVIKAEKLIFKDKSLGFSWCHLYELDPKDHFKLLYKGFSEDEEFQKILKQFISSSDQFSTIPQMQQNITNYFDTHFEEVTEEEARELMPAMGEFFGIGMSVYFSLSSVLYYGLFINELVAKARSGDDKALFDAIRLDSTVIGCQTAMNRISKAKLLDDKSFFKKLKAALTGNKTKREQANYQKMRLVLELLYEAKCEKLTDDNLYELFVDTLNLYSWHERDGGNAKALRKFVDTYMKKNATT